MIELKYVNSKGDVAYLLGDYIQAFDGGLHSYSWKANTTSKKIGSKVNYISRDSIKFKITICLRGGIKQRYKNLDDLHDLFETDVVLNTPGKLYFNKYYLECFVTDSTTSINKMNCRTNLEVTVQGFEGMWREDEKHSFRVEHEGSFSMPFNFPLNYDADFKNVPIVNDSVVGCDFVMTVFGEVTNPKVTIGGHEYLVNVSLNSGDKLVIDSKKKTITKITSSGSNVNCFKNRSKSSYIFEKIKKGVNAVSWDNTFGFDLVMIKERSEPKWM